MRDHRGSTRLVRLSNAVANTREMPMPTNIDAIYCSLLSSGNIVACLCVMHPEVYRAGLHLETLARTVRDLREEHPERELRFFLPKFRPGREVVFIEFDADFLLASHGTQRWRYVDGEALMAALVQAFRVNPNADILLRAAETDLSNLLDLDARGVH